MNPGKLNRKITLQSVVQGGKDADGYPLEPTIKEVRLSAMVKPVSAREYHAAKASQTENVTRFIIRYKKDIDDSMKVIYNGRKFEIESIINDDDQNITLTIIGREIV